MKRHTIVCPPGFVERYGKCVPQGNTPFSAPAGPVRNVVPFVPDNVPPDDGGGSTDYLNTAAKVIRYAGMSKKAYDSLEALEEDLAPFKALENEEDVEVITFNHENPLDSYVDPFPEEEETPLKARAEEAAAAEDVAAAEEKYAQLIARQDELEHLGRLAANTEVENDPNWEEWANRQVEIAKNRREYSPEADESELSPEARRWNQLTVDQRKAEMVNDLLDDVPNAEYRDGQIWQKNEDGEWGVEETKGESMEEQATRIAEEHSELKQAEFKSKYGDVEFGGPKGGAPDAIPDAIQSVDAGSTNPFVVGEQFGPEQRGEISKVKGAPAEYKGDASKKFFPDQWKPTDIPPPEITDDDWTQVNEFDDWLEMKPPPDAGATTTTYTQGGSAGAAERVESGFERPLVPIEQAPGPGADVLPELPEIGAIDSLDAAIVGAAGDAFEAASALAPELAMGLVVGGVAYGLEKGVEKTLDIGMEQDKLYFDNRNEELGSRKMDKREIDHQMKELNAAHRLYKDKVEHQNFGTGAESKRQHEKDKAMLKSIESSIDAIHRQQSTGEPVYVVVGDGFNADNLSDADKKEYERLQQRVANAEQRVFYEGADRSKLEKQEARLQQFVEANSNSAIPMRYVNAPSQADLQQVSENYVKYGDQVFGNMDQDTLDLLGYSSIMTPELQQQRLEAGNQQVQQQVQQTKANLEGSGLVASQGGVA